MDAHVGDRIVIHGHKVGEPLRDCRVLEIRGDDGGPPFLVEWGDTGHESLFFPGSDATIDTPHHDPHQNPHHHESENESEKVNHGSK